MKKPIKLHGLKSARKLILIHIALIAVIGFSIAACGDDGGGGARTVTYSGKTTDGDLYSLKIIENTSNPNRAVLDDPMAGDNFELTWKKAPSTN